MAPRGQALPQATTESAKEARKSFFCELCQKGYARMNDFEAHEGSYDHQHRKRLKEMKQLTKDPNASLKAREAERKANEEAGIKSINLSLNPNSSGTTTKKKPVFKSIVNQSQKQVSSASSIDDAVDEAWVKEYYDDPTQMVANGWEGERFDPRFPAGRCRRCNGRCRGHGTLDPGEGFGEYCVRTQGEAQAWVRGLPAMEI